MIIKTEQNNNAYPVQPEPTKINQQAPTYINQPAPTYTNQPVNTNYPAPMYAQGPVIIGTSIVSPYPMQTQVMEKN